MNEGNDEQALDPWGSGLGEKDGLMKRGRDVATYCPRLVCRSSVMNVDMPGQMQLFAIIAYLNKTSSMLSPPKFK